MGPIREPGDQLRALLDEQDRHVPLADLGERAEHGVDHRRSEAERGLVEQRAQLIAGFADRTHVLNNGQIRMSLTPAEAKDTDRMIAAYLS